MEVYISCIWEHACGVRFSGRVVYAVLKCSLVPYLVISSHSHDAFHAIFRLDVPRPDVSRLDVSRLDVSRHDVSRLVITYLVITCLVITCVVIMYLINFD